MEPSYEPEVSGNIPDIWYFAKHSAIPKLTK
jgi:hypothetical protein